MTIGICRYEWVERPTGKQRVLGSCPDGVNDTQRASGKRNVVTEKSGEDMTEKTTRDMREEETEEKRRIHTMRKEIPP